MKLSARNREKWKKPILLITLIVHSSNKTNTFDDWFWFNQRIYKLQHIEESFIHYYSECYVCALNYRIAQPFVSHKPPLRSNVEYVIHSSGLFRPSIQTKLLLVIKLGHRFYILRYTFSVEVKSVLHFNLTGADTSQPWTRLLLNSTSLLPRLLALAFSEAFSSALGVFYWYR